MTGIPACTGLHELRHVGGHAGADDDELLLFEGALAVVAGFDTDAVVEQLRDFVVKFFFRLGVGDGDASALVSQKKRAGDA